MQIKTVQSDLTLEKLIYFNSFYSLVHAASLIFQASYRCNYHQLDPKVALIMPIFTAVWCFVELFRLRLGSFGNRNESVRGCGRCAALRCCAQVGPGTPAPCWGMRLTLLPPSSTPTPFPLLCALRCQSSQPFLCSPTCPSCQ